MNVKTSWAEPLAFRHLKRVNVLFILTDVAPQRRGSAETSDPGHKSLFQGVQLWPHFIAGHNLDLKLLREAVLTPTSLWTSLFKTDVLHQKTSRLLAFYRGSADYCDQTHRLQRRVGVRSSTSGFVENTWKIWMTGYKIGGRGRSGLQKCHFLSSALEA